MTGTILENLSGRKLTILVSCLLIGQFLCFLIGGLLGKNLEENLAFPLDFFFVYTQPLKCLVNIL